jgi:hypothetical protein
LPTKRNKYPVQVTHKVRSLLLKADLILRPDMKSISVEAQKGRHLPKCFPLARGALLFVPVIKNYTDLLTFLLVFYVSDVYGLKLEGRKDAL